MSNPYMTATYASKYVYIYTHTYGINTYIHIYMSHIDMYTRRGIWLLFGYLNRNGLRSSESLSVLYGLRFRSMHDGTANLAKERPV